MLLEEARWFGREISRFDFSAIFPMLNLGSSIASCRESVQPWIDSYVFKPIRDAGQRVIHADIKADSGVDLVGNILERDFRDRLRALEVKSVFCSNLLEHTREREKIAEAIVSIIPVGGIIFVSCPFRYPYHLDPIDTKFRPDPSRLAELFPGTSVRKAEILRDHNYFHYVSSPKNIIKKLIRIWTPFYRPARWLSAMCHLGWLFRHFYVTCVILQKDDVIVDNDRI